jgi:hypothetical protein
MEALMKIDRNAGRERFTKVKRAKAKPDAGVVEAIGLGGKTPN